jgi:putative CocE/NonD family hydrolase
MACLPLQSCLRTWLLGGMIGLGLLPVMAQTGPSRPIYSVRREYNVMVPMRDGVRLSTDVYRPDAPGRFPVILERTPYDNAMSAPRSYDQRGAYYASRGYVYAVQDVRGRYDSEGEWYPLFHEAQDGYDAQEWAGTQSWSSGKVGTIGGSYGGWDQWLPAPLANSHLACMVPYVAPPNPFRNVPFENGVLLVPWAQWMLFMDGRTNQMFGDSLESVFDDVPEQAYSWSKISQKLPVSKMDEFAGRHVSWWKDMMEHDSFDAYWKRLDFGEHYDRINVPAFHITGWYDGDFPGSFINYPAMVKGAKTEFARRHQKIIIGPWPHGVNEARQLGGADFGQASMIDLDRLVLRWFDHWLKGIDNGIDREPPVRIFVMGENEWRDEQEWPLASAQNTKYYLHSRGAANTFLGDGSLSVTAPSGDEFADRYTYDPKDPTPEMPAIFGPDYPPSVNNRMDVLVYQTPPLQEAMEVTGPVTLKLYAASSAPDTDFFARLSDVQPDGYIRGLGHGIIRARFRESLEHPTLLKPNQVYEYTIEVWPTSNVFEKDHRIRLDIASAAFPGFFPNLNTRQNNQTSTEVQIAKQTIYHDANHASYLLLPIIPRPAAARTASAREFTTRTP